MGGAGSSIRRVDPCRAPRRHTNCGCAGDKVGGVAAKIARAVEFITSVRRVTGRVGRSCLPKRVRHPLPIDVSQDRDELMSFFGPVSPGAGTPPEPANPRYVKVKWLIVLLLLVAPVWAGPGFLGASCGDVTTADSERQKIPLSEGAVVKIVLPGSPAASIGLIPGDVIYALNDTRVVNAQQFTSVTSGAPPGTPVDVKIYRRGQRVTLRTTLADRDKFVGAMTAAAPPPGANLKKEFLESVRRFATACEAGDGLSTLYFQLADEEAMVRTADGYLVGVAEDPDYLRTFKLGKYLQTLLGKRVETIRGLTQPKNLSGWDTLATPQESRYNGWVILAGHPAGDQATAFHECIHVVHLQIGSNADDDFDAAPEDICNTFRAVVADLRTIVDPLIEQAGARADAGQDVSRERDQIFRRVDAQRQRLSLATASFAPCLANIGGKADWNGYKKAIGQRLKRKPKQKPPTPAPVGVIGFWKGTWTDSNGASGAGRIEVMWHDPSAGIVYVTLGRWQLKGTASGNTATFGAPSIGRERLQVEGHFTASGRDGTCVITARSPAGAVTTTNWRVSR